MFCPRCGKQAHDSAIMCEYCGQTLKQDAAPGAPVYPANNGAPVYPGASAPAAVKENPENVVTGIVGALLGAAIGAAAIILLDLAGYMAAISGVILAVCAYKGYELLGGKLSKTGIIISTLLILVTPYVADRISWAIFIMNEFENYGIAVTFAEAFSVVHELADEETYMSTLGMLYLFTALGAFSVVRKQLKLGKKRK